MSTAYLLSSGYWLGVSFPIHIYTSRIYHIHSKHWVFGCTHDALEQCLSNHVWWRIGFSISNPSRIYVWSYCASPVCTPNHMNFALWVRQHQNCSNSCMPNKQQIVIKFSSVYPQFLHLSHHTPVTGHGLALSPDQFEEQWTPVSIGLGLNCSSIFLSEAFWVSVLSSAKWWYL